MTKEQVNIFLRKIQEKNSWGKNEIRTLFLEVIAGLHDE